MESHVHETAMAEQLTEDAPAVNSPCDIDGHESPSLLHDEDIIQKDTVAEHLSHDSSDQETPMLLYSEESDQEDMVIEHSPCDTTSQDCSSRLNKVKDVVEIHIPQDYTGQESPSLLNNVEDMVGVYSPHDNTDQASPSLLHNAEDAVEVHSSYENTRRASPSLLNTGVGHSPHNITDPECPSPIHKEEVSHDSHSPHDITGQESPSLLHYKEISQEDIIVAHSPHNITNEERPSLLNNEEVKQEDKVVVDNPHNITDHEFPSLVCEELNQEDIVVEHSPHNITERESPSLLNNEEVNQEDIVVGHSPHDITEQESPSEVHDEEVNQEDIVVEHRPHDITEQESPSEMHDDEVNQEDIVVGHSPHDITEQESPSEVHDEEVNQEDIVVGHSPHDIIEQESSSEVHDEEVNQEDIVVGHSPHDITEQESPSEMHDEEVNQEDIVVRHSPHDITEQESPSEVRDEKVNQEDIVVGHSPHDITEQESPSEVHDEEVNQEDMVVGHSPHEITEQESPSEVHDEEVNQEDIVVGHSPHDITDQESASLPNNEEVNPGDIVVADSPRNVIGQESPSLTDSEEENLVIVDSPCNITDHESPSLIHGEEVNHGNIVVNSAHNSQESLNLVYGEEMSEEDTVVLPSPNDITGHESPSSLHHEEIIQEDKIVVYGPNDIIDWESPGLIHGEKISKKDIVEHSSHDLNCNESMPICGEEDSSRIVQVVNGQEISMVDDSVTLNSNEFMVMYVDNLQADISCAEEEHADEENLNESFVEIEEYVILKAIHEISSFNSICRQCKTEWPCSFMVPEFEDEIIYLCNGACVNNFQKDYPNQFIVIKKSYVIVEKEPLLTKCSECNETKMCYFCYEGEDINFCSMTCLQSRMGDEQQKYVFNRREIVVSEGPPLKEICFVCDKIRQCVFPIKRYGEQLYVCQKSCMEILNAREDNRYRIIKMEKHKVPTKRPPEQDLDPPLPKTTRDATGQKLSGKCEKVVKRPHVSTAIDERENTFCRRCANCKCREVINKQILNWETMEFCSKFCLLTYQKTIGDKCVQCKAEVKAPALGKYSLRMGHDLHQFCGKVCLWAFNKTLKTCNYCQRMITDMCYNYNAKFCSKDCVEKFKYMNKMPIPVRADCVVCSKETITKIEVELNENESRRLCSEACLSAFQSAVEIIHDKCEYCKKYFIRETSRCFIIYEISNEYYFCSIVCLNIYLRKTQKLGYCVLCRVLKLTFDMIKRKEPSGQIILACSIHCLNLYDNESIDPSGKLKPYQKKCRTYKKIASVMPITVTSGPSLRKSPVKINEVPRKPRTIPAPTRTSARIAKSGVTSLAFTLNSTKRLRTGQAQPSTTASTPSSARTPTVSHSAATPVAVPCPCTLLSAKKNRSSKPVATPSAETASPEEHSTAMPIDVEPSAATPASGITSPAARVVAKPTILKTLPSSANRLNAKRVSFTTIAATPVIETAPATFPSAATVKLPAAAASTATPTSTTMALIRARPFSAKRVVAHPAATPTADEPSAATPAADEPSTATPASAMYLPPAFAIAKPVSATMSSATRFATTPATTALTRTTSDIPASKAELFLNNYSLVPAPSAPRMKDSPVADSPLTASPRADYVIADSAIKDSPITNSSRANSPIVDYVIEDSAIEDSPIADFPNSDSSRADSPIADYAIADSAIKDSPITDSPRANSLHKSYQNQRRFGVRSALARRCAGSESDDMYSDGEAEAPSDAGPAELRTLSRILREHITLHVQYPITSSNTPEQDSRTNGVDHTKTTIPEPQAFTWSTDFSTFTGIRETYSKKPGIPIPNRKPHELFCTVWDLEIVTHIVKQTNEYVKQTMHALSEADRIALSREWHDTTVGEIYKLFAILNYMSIDNRARIDEYWTTGVLGMPQFRDIMSRKRFCILMAFLHFADNEVLQARSDERKISKIAPIFDHCNHKFISMYSPQQVLSLDEVVMQFKSDNTSTQRIHEKKDCVVINSLELCEAATGYTLRSLLYEGNGSRSKLALILDGFLDAGHMLVLDNWYHQLTYARYLKRQRRTDVIGVINRRQINVPNQIRDVDELQMVRDDQIALHCGDIAIIAWMGTKLVTAISTCHNADPVWPRHYGKGLTPKLIDCYNRHIVGRHRKDKYLSMYTVEKKHKDRWYMKVFRRLLNTSFLNTFIIYNRQNQVTSLTYRDFRYAVSEGLLDACSIPYHVSKPELPIRLKRDKDHDHFPVCSERDKITGKLTFKKCVCCWLKGGKRMTRSVCRTCQVSLCIQCWTDYHTKWEL